jgi:hypothetical protein
MNQYIVVILSAAVAGNPADQYLVVDTTWTGGPAVRCVCGTKSAADTIAAALNA